MALNRRQLSAATAHRSKGEYKESFAVGGVVPQAPNTLLPRRRCSTRVHFPLDFWTVMYAAVFQLPKVTYFAVHALYRQPHKLSGQGC